MFGLVVDLLSQGGELAQERILQLLWEFSSSEIAKGKIKDKYSVTMKVLEDLQSHPNSSLQCLAFCVLWSIGKSDPLGKKVNL